MSKRQKTPGFFGFSKKIAHRGERIKVELPEHVTNKSKKSRMFDMQKEILQYSRAWST